jgi:Tol biopolymer transport system component
LVWLVVLLTLHVVAGAVVAAAAPRTAIVFAAFEPAGYRSDLFTIRPNGTGVANLTNTPNMDEQWPSFSRDGTKIVFRRGNVDRWETTEIYTIDRDGGHRTRVTHNDAADSSPQWTPNGRRVVFMSNRNDADPTCMDWPCNWDIFTARADGSHVRQLTTSTAQDVFPTVSPDGQKVLFQRMGASSAASALWVMDIDGSNSHRLTAPALKAGGAAWSPDGSRIAFQDQACRACGQSDIWLIDADGSDPVRVTDTVANETNVGWSPNGESLVVQVDLGQHSGIDRMRADGSHRSHVTLPEHGDAFEPSWAPAAGS